MIKVGDFVRIRKNQVWNQGVYSELSGIVTDIGVSVGFCRVELDSKSAKKIEDRNNTFREKWNKAPVIFPQLLEVVNKTLITE